MPHRNATQRSVLRLDWYDYQFGFPKLTEKRWFNSLKSCVTMPDIHNADPIQEAEEICLLFSEAFKRLGSLLAILAEETKNTEAPDHPQ